MLLACIGILLGLRSECRAQDAATAAVFLPSDTDRELLLQRVEESLARSDWDGVVEGLTRFAEWITAPPKSSVVASGGGMAPGTASRFGRLASLLPPDALRRYRGRLDPLVQAAWSDASLIGGETLRQLRRRIIREYPQASLFEEALETETDHAAESGYWLTVRELVDRWLESFGGREDVSPERKVRARLLRIAALRALDDADGVRRERQALRDLDRTTLPRGEAAAEALRRELDSDSLDVPERPPAMGSFELGAPVWESTDVDRRTFEFIQERARSAPREMAPIPFFPVVRDGVVALQSSTRLVLLDWREAREVWSVETTVGRYHPDQALIPLLDDDLCVYARGDALVALDATTGATRWGVRFEYDAPTKGLRWADLSSSQGPSLPERIRESETLAPPSAVVAPPTLFEGKIITGVDVRLTGERLLYLVSLERSGRVRWRTFLGSSQSEDYLSLGGHGSVPLVEGSRVFYLTNSGILAALDGVDGTILWELEYPRLGSRGAREAIRTEDRWQMSPLVLAGGSLWVAPQDSATLLAVEPSRGFVEWRCPRGPSVALLGADDDACYCAGSSVLAIAHSGPERGRVLWEVTPGLAEDAAGRPRRDGKAPVLGRGVVVDDRISVPSAVGLHTIDARDGRAVDTTLWEFGVGAGNLARCGPRLVVIGTNGFSLYSSKDEQRGRLPPSLAGGPEARLEWAKFHLRNLEIDEGLDHLEEWRKTVPLPPTPNSRLDHLYLDVAEILRALSEREAIPAPETRGTLLRFRMLLERTPRRKVEAAIHYAEHLERHGRVEEAIMALHEALSFDNPQTDFSVQPFATLGSRSYIREKLRRLREAHTGSVKAVDDAALKLLIGARQKATSSAYAEVLRLYPYSRPAATAYLELARLYEARQDPRHAIAALEAYREDFPDHADSLPSAVWLAELLLQAGDTAKAEAVFRTLLASREDAIEQGARRARQGETVGAFARRQLAGLEGASGRMPHLRFPARMAWRSPADLQAVSRAFLEPRGLPPAELDGCFLTQSVEVVECREIDSGLPRWRTHLELIPGFQFSKSAIGFHLPRTGSSMLHGSYAGPLLILNDDRNLFAVEAATGQVRWHLPVGMEDGDAPGGLLRQLRERIRGVRVTDSAVFRTSSGSRGGAAKRYLARLSADDGGTEWEVELDYEPDVFAPALHRDLLLVAARRPLGIHVHAAGDGHHLSARSLESPLRSEPTQTDGGLWIVPTSSELLGLDFSRGEGRLVWKVGSPSSRLEAVHLEETAPHEYLVVLRNPEGQVRVISVDVESGEERWSYGGLPESHNSFSLTRSGPDIYLVHGESRLTGTGSWLLLGLRIVPGPDGPAPVPLWRDPVELESLIGISTRHNLHVTRDSLLLAEPTGAVSIYDKDLGIRKSALATPISQFLTEKGNFESALLEGRLILLTDSGDCAFESVPEPALVEDFSQTPFIRAFLDAPESPEAALALAKHYFREEDLDRAIGVLNGLLASERILTRSPPRVRFQARYLLDGFREEKMRRRIPTITCPAMTRPPAIDGKLDDPWNVGTRIRLESPESVGRIPSGSQRHHWEGAEDLSAVLYTGWDATYFYAALDVTDDVLHPYDRDAENWTGDCLIIGVDPTGDGGYRQHGNDQLMTLALTVPRRNKQDKEPDEDRDEGEGEGEEADEDEERKPDGLFSVKKKDDDSGAIYEIALPWATFSDRFTQGAEPKAGFQFGLSLLLTDDDTGQGATKSISINPCQLLPKSQKSSWVWRFIIPHFFPRVILE